MLLTQTPELRGADREDKILVSRYYHGISISWEAIKSGSFIDPFPIRVEAQDYRKIINYFK